MKNIVIVFIFSFICMNGYVQKIYPAFNFYDTIYFTPNLLLDTAKVNTYSIVSFSNDYEKTKTGRKYLYYIDNKTISSVHVENKAYDLPPKSEYNLKGYFKTNTQKKQLVSDSLNSKSIITTGYCLIFDFTPTKIIYDEAENCFKSENSEIMFNLYDKKIEKYNEKFEVIEYYKSLIFMDERMYQVYYILYKPIDTGFYYQTQGVFVVTLNGKIHYMEDF